MPAWNSFTKQNYRSHLNSVSNPLVKHGTLTSQEIPAKNFSKAGLPSLFERIDCLSSWPGPT